MSAYHSHTANRGAVLVLLALFCCSCKPESLEPIRFDYPDSKFWAHGVNTMEMIEERAPYFDGMEIDIVYSEWQEELYVGHELWDTVQALTLDMWLDALPEPDAHHLWLDLKNLTTDNAAEVASKIIDAMKRHGIEGKVMVESQEGDALRIVRGHGLPIMLWINSPYWTGQSEKKWIKKAKSKIRQLHPDAISSDHHAFPLFPETFPDEKFHIWDTPREYNDTNVEHSRKIADNHAVRIVLVDYPMPVD